MRSFSCIMRTSQLQRPCITKPQRTVISRTYGTAGQRAMSNSCAKLQETRSPPDNSTRTFRTVQGAMSRVAKKSIAADILSRGTCAVMVLTHERFCPRCGREIASPRAHRSLAIT